MKEKVLEKIKDAHRAVTDDELIFLVQLIEQSAESQFCEQAFYLLSAQLGSLHIALGLIDKQVLDMPEQELVSIADAKTRDVYLRFVRDIKENDMVKKRNYEGLYILTISLVIVITEITNVLLEIVNKKIKRVI